MILNILVVVFLLGMTILWSTYGFFSAFLNLLVVVCAGLLAFGLWEPVSHWLLGMGWSSAWGVGLLLPYVLTLGVLRVGIISLVRKNLGFHPVVDQVGGGALGLAAGVLTAGILVVGAGEIAPDKDLLGVQPYLLNGLGKAEKNGKGAALWVPVDSLSGDFFESLSAGAFSPTGNSRNLASEHPNLAQTASLHGVVLDPNVGATHIASPEGVTVTGVYAVDYTPEAAEWLLARASAYALMRQTEVDKIPLNYDGKQMANDVSDTVAAMVKAGKDPEAELFDKKYLAEARLQLAKQAQLPGEIVLQSVLAYAMDQVPGGVSSGKDGKEPAPTQKLFAQGMSNKKLVLVDTVWDAAKSNAYDEAALRLSPSQIVLRTESANKKQAAGEKFLPLAWSAPMLSSEFFKRRELVELTDVHPGIYGTNGTNGGADHLAFLFAVPKDAVLSSVQLRELRFALDKSDVKKIAIDSVSTAKMSPDAAVMAQLLGHLLPSEVAPGAGSAPSVNPKANEPIVIQSATIEWTSRMPRTLSWASPVLGADVQEDKKDFKLIKGTFDQEPVKDMGMTILKINNLLMPAHRRCARVMMTLAQCQAIWGRQLDADRGLYALKLRAESEPLSPVGFVVVRGDQTSSVHIDCNRGLPVTGKVLNDLRPILGSEDKVYIYYFVDDLDTVEGFGLWDPASNKAIKDRQYDLPEKVPMRQVSAN